MGSMRHIVAVISTKGKAIKQISNEMNLAVRKYQKASKDEVAQKLVDSLNKAVLQDEQVL